MPQNPLLSQLEGLIDPAQTSWWPLAPGWWILALLLVVVLIAVTFLLVKKSRQNAYKKEALNHLNNLKSQQQDTIANINILLKKTAISAYGRQTVSRLTGEDWVHFLIARNTKDKISESDKDQLKTTFCESLYTSQKNQTNENLYRFAQNWIKHHENTKQKQSAKQKQDKMNETKEANHA